jgi:HD-like signal output (HDOD) protein
MTKLQLIEINPKTFLREHCSLPPLPAIARQLQDMLKENTADIGKVTELINSDPAIIAQIMKIVNSAYYSLPREISSIRYAIAFLGFSEVSRIVLALSVINTLAVKDRRAVEEFWYHSFYTALITRHLASKIHPYLSIDELWTAAILHDVGKLVYLKFFPDHCKAIQAYCSEQCCLFSEAENHLGFPTSSYLGILLCDHWRLPDKVRCACEYHNLNDLRSLEKDSPLVDLKQVICLGNLLSSLSSGGLNENLNREISEAIQTSLNYDASSYMALLTDIYGLKLDVDRFVDTLR